MLYFIREAYFSMKVQHKKTKELAGVAEPALVLAPALSDLLNPKTEGIDYSENYSM